MHVVHPEDLFTNFSSTFVLFYVCPLDGALACFNLIHIVGFSTGSLSLDLRLSSEDLGTRVTAFAELLGRES